VAIIEGRRGEVVVNGVNIEARKRIGRGLRPLPNIARNIVKVAVSKLVNWGRRGEVIEMNFGIGANSAVPHKQLSGVKTHTAIAYA